MQRVCEPIARELGEAYADAWAPSDQESREAWTAIHKLKGGTEEDVVHAEEIAARAEVKRGGANQRRGLQAVSS